MQASRHVRRPGGHLLGLGIPTGSFGDTLPEIRVGALFFAGSFETKLDDVMLVVCAGGRLDTYTAIRQN